MTTRPLSPGTDRQKANEQAWRDVEDLLVQAETMAMDTGGIVVITFPLRDDHGPLAYNALHVQAWLTEAAFEDSWHLIEDAGFIRAHTFPFAYRWVREDEHGIVRGAVRRLDDKGVPSAKSLLRRYLREAVLV